MSSEDEIVIDDLIDFDDIKKLVNRIRNDDNN